MDQEKEKYISILLGNKMKQGKLSTLAFKPRYSYVKDIPFTEKDLRCSGAKFQVVKFLPRTSIKPHFHKTTVEIFYVQAGTGIIKLNNKEFRCKPDDFFLCEPGDMHEFINDTNKEFVILIFKTNEKEEDIYWENFEETA